MARKRRDLDTSEWFHVYNRGADRQDIYSLDGDHEVFEHIIDDALPRFDAAVHAYAWMSNHFHFVVHAPNRALPELMQRIGKRYGAAYNQRTARSGPLFDTRFRSVPIVGDPHFLQTSRYVHRNPLAFTPPGSLATYRSSSLGCYLGVRNTPTWLTTERLGGLIHPDRYLDVVLDPTDDDLDWINGLPPLLRPTCHQIDEAVHLVTGRDPRSSRSPSRTLAITVATDLRADDVVAIADRYGVTTASVRQSARRGRIRNEREPSFGAARRRVLQHLNDAESRSNLVRM